MTIENVCIPLEIAFDILLILHANTYYCTDKAFNGYAKMFINSSDWAMTFIRLKGILIDHCLEHNLPIRDLNKIGFT